MKEKYDASVLWAVLAAALYAVSTPVSKLLLEEVGPAMLSAWLYLGAGAGMCAVGLIRKKAGTKEQPLTKRELPYIIGMIVLDVAAPICLMLGLTMTSAASVSLLNNFEIAATALIALIVFKESISGRLWLAICLITASSILLSLEDAGSFAVSPGSLLVLLVCVCWGLENNCTRMMAGKDPLEIVVLKGFGAGLGSLAVACAVGETIPPPIFLLKTMLLGLVAYGLSIFFYVYAQRKLGAAKTSAYYALAPFFGAALSFALFQTLPNAHFLVALLIMMAGAYLASARRTGD